MNVGNDLDFTQMLYEITSDSFKMAIEEMKQTSNATTNAQRLLELCRLVTKKIDIYTKQQYIRSAQKKITLYYNRSTNRGSQEEADIMIYATQLIYLLRTFITGEEITYHMATKSANGKYQASAFIPQSQILTNLSKTRQNAIGVSHVLQQELINNNINNTMELKRKNLWHRVEYLSEVKYLPGKNINKIDMRKPGSKEAHWAYQNQKQDIQIYLLYSGKNRIKYYDTEGKGLKKSLQQFNNGWLWEWYNSILYGEDEQMYYIANDAIQRGSLKYIIQNKDQTPGTKQGDYQDMLGRQIQSKYANNKIISYNNIRNIIYNLEMALIQYTSEENQSDEKLISLIQEHFLPESVQVGNRYANDVIREFLSSLNAPIKS